MIFYSYCLLHISFVVSGNSPPDIGVQSEGTNSGKNCPEYSLYQIYIMLYQKKKIIQKILVDVLYFLSALHISVAKNRSGKKTSRGGWREVRQIGEINERTNTSTKLCSCVSRRRMFNKFTVLNPGYTHTFIYNYIDIENSSPSEFHFFSSFPDQNDLTNVSSSLPSLKRYDIRKFLPKFHSLILDASKWSFIDSTAAREVVSIISKFQALGVRVLLTSASCKCLKFLILR